MILGNGIDIIEIERINRAINRNKDFLNRVFTKVEKKYIEDRKENPNTIAGLFAAKEAVCKALGTGLRGFKWQDIEIKHNSQGKPEINLKGIAKELAQEKGISIIHISISHNNKDAIAFAIAEGSQD